jgi:ADP-ribose pyrophosphatase YjhB (NUDIX family)
MFRPNDALSNHAARAVADLPVATVGALVVGPSNRVLLIRTHKWRGTWGVPGGKIEYGETMREALVRELREETGLIVRDIRLGPVQEAVESEEFHRPAHFLLLNFLARSDSEGVRLNEEAQEFAWLSPDEAADLELNSFTRRLLAFYRETGFAAAPLADPAGA